MTDGARSKVAARATRTSDVTRARTLALAAVGAAVGASAVLAATAMPTGSERPLAPSHVAPKIACATCHDAPAGSPLATSAGRDPLSSRAPSGALGGRDPLSSRAPSGSSAGAPAPYVVAGACKTCHAASKHVSTRSPHRALAARGVLTCAMCHPSHEGAQGVTFGERGSFVRWGAASGPGADAGVNERGQVGVTVTAGATVPLVALKACATCHDPSSASDPVARCVPASLRSASRARDPSALATTASLCFDEHRAASGGGLARAAAWDAAREAMSKTSWVSSTQSSRSPWLPLGGGMAGALALGASASLLERRARAKSAAPAAAHPGVPAARRRLPTINPSTCLGCYACVDVCPFDVLAIERYVAVVVRPDECCGVVLCEQVCPNGSLTITEGEPALDRPGVDEHLESVDVPGLFVAGDLTGLPLIKNAINQGVRAIDRIGATMPRKRREAVDVIIVGAGPAGLSAALRAQERGLSYVVLEQATVAASVKSFPRDKIVYDPPLDLPIEGALWMKEATKEELVAQWTRIVRARAVDVREGRRVTNVARDGDGASGAFVVTCAREDAGEETFRASRIVLAIGRRGTPRTLDLRIEPGAEGHVSYALADARSFAGKRVVIAGLGDTAMEAAIAIARQPATTVTISYRGATFTRGKARNIAEVKELVAKGRLRLLFETSPVAVSRTSVTLAGVTPGKAGRTVEAEGVIVMVGGIPSWELLGRIGIRRSGERREEREQATDNGNGNGETRAT